jgi:cytochrome P450
MSAPDADGPAADCDPTGARVAAPGPTRLDQLRGLPLLARDPLEYLRAAVDTYGPVVAFPMWRSSALLVDDPGGVRRILQDNHRNYSKATFQYAALSAVTGQGLLTSDGVDWRRHRRLLQPAFHRDALRDVAEQSVRVARAAGAAVDEAHGPVDADALFMTVTLDVVGRALFGADLAAGEAGTRLISAVNEALDAVMQRASRPWTAITGLPTPTGRRLARSVRDIDDAVSRMIDSRRADADERSGGAAAPRGTGSQEGTRTSDVLGLLLSAPDGRVSEREVRDELVTLVIAGHETVASSLTWTLRLLAEHDEAQDSVHRELDLTLGGPRGPAPGPEDLGRLPVTRAVVDEGLRLYPPAWVVTRRALSADVIAGVLVPAGTVVLVSPWLQHRRPEIWPEPGRFDPGRWTEEGAGRSAAGRVEGYLPFGAGPRLCIGRDVALVESVLVLAELLRARRVGPVGPRPHAVAGVTLRPRGGAPLVFTAR